MSTGLRDKLWVFIPSYGRAKHAARLSLRFVSPYIKSRTFLVVPEDQFLDYRRQWRNNVHILKTPPEVDSLGKTQCWIVNKCKEYGIKKHVQMDDDQSLSYKRGTDPSKPWSGYRPTNEELDALWMRMEDLLDSYPAVGLLPRMLLHTHEEPLKLVGPMIGVCAYRTNVISRLPLGKMDYLHDHFITLLLLMRGYQNAIICDWSQGHRSASMEGGQTSRRTPEELEATIDRFVSFFPEVATKHWKKRAGSEELWPNLKIRWKDAYAIGWHRRFGEHHG